MHDKVKTVERTNQLSF